jgi:hypothetical protein
MPGLLELLAQGLQQQQGVLSQQPVGLLADLVDQMNPNQRALLYGSTPGGAATVNPYMLMRSPRVIGLLHSLLAQNPNGPKLDTDPPKRNIMNVPSQPFGNRGVLSNPFPGARLPNAYRGPLTEPGVPGVPNAPQYYVPGFTDPEGSQQTYVLRGT